MLDNLKPQVNCIKHGLQGTRFVCLHIAHATQSKAQVGFYWSEKDDDLPPIAWCAACEDYISQPNVQWDEAFEVQAQFVTFCNVCFEDAKTQLLK